MNRFLKKIDKHLAEIGMPPKKLYEHFKTSERYFRSAKNNFPSDTRGNNFQKPFKIDFVCHMVLACNIDPKTFLLNDQELKIWNQNKKVGDHTKRYFKGDVIFTKWSPQNNIKDFVDLSFNPASTDSRRKFKQKYFKSVSPWIGKARDTVQVSEFLGKGSIKAPGFYLNAYHEAHEKLFEEIEELISKFKESGPRYKRVLTVPREKISKGDNDFALIIQAILLCSLTTFKHICRCLKKGLNAKFCVALADRQRSFTLIKGDTKIILTEYYKYNSESVLIPDVLFIDESAADEGIVDEFFNTYSEEINGNFGKNIDLHLTKPTLERYLNSAKDYLYKGSADPKKDVDEKLIKNMDKKINAFRRIWQF